VSEIIGPPSIMTAAAKRHGPAAKPALSGATARAESRDPEVRREIEADPRRIRHA